jgi:hypothetical protein
MRSGTPRALMAVGLVQALAAEQALTPNAGKLMGDELRVAPGAELDGVYVRTNTKPSNMQCPDLRMSSATPIRQQHFNNAAARAEYKKRLCQQVSVDLGLDPATIDPKKFNLTAKNMTQMLGHERFKQAHEHALAGLTHDVPVHFGFTRKVANSARQIPNMKKHSRTRETERRARQIAAGQVQTGHYPTMAERRAS